MGLRRSRVFLACHHDRAHDDGRSDQKVCLRLVTSDYSAMGWKTNHHGKIWRFFAELGPGLITGAADDDPSGVSTYSVTGAAFGYAPLWTVLFSFPMMVAVQLMCARLAMVTGRGLASAVRQRYPRWVLWGACVLLVTANVFN